VKQKRTFVDIPEIVFAMANEHDSDGAPNLYARYWSSYRGRHFDTLVRRSDPWRFTEIDMVALNMLSVRLDFDGIASLLFDIRIADEASRLLRRIPPETPLHTVDDAVLGEGSAAVELWQLLRSQVRGVGTGFTVITKLMAAKRPHLFPIWDSRIADAIDLPRGELWKPMHSLVRNAEARQKMDDATSKYASTATLLRRIDTALWLYGDRMSRETSTTSHSAS
jgi:hypothetical protein